MFSIPCAPVRKYMMKFYVELGRKRSFAFAGAAAAAQPHGSHNPYCVLAAKRFRSLRRTRSHTLSVAANEYFDVWNRVLWDTEMNAQHQHSHNINLNFDKKKCTQQNAQKPGFNSNSTGTGSGCVVEIHSWCAKYRCYQTKKKKKLFMKMKENKK